MPEDPQERMGRISLLLREAVELNDQFTRDYPELTKILGLGSSARQMRQYFEDNILDRVKTFIAAYDEVRNAGRR